MSRKAAPFSIPALLALVLVGTGTFLLFLYAIAMGWTGNDSMTATERADSNALNGFSGLVDLLERRGHSVTVARGRHNRADAGWEEELLILTPGMASDPADLSAVIEAQRYNGPLIVILPKWAVLPLQGEQAEGRPDEWVNLQPGFAPSWFDQVEAFDGLELGNGRTRDWRGFGLVGNLPQSDFVQGIESDSAGKLVMPIVTDTEGDIMAGYWNLDGASPIAASQAYNGDTNGKASGPVPTAEGYPFVIVAEPDLMNNYGMGEETRARVAIELVEATMDYRDMPIVFDMEIDGMGDGANLLTLAVRPPFLAATLCLLAALLVVGWRAFRRFGPPLADQPAMAHGKTQLATNGAALIQRTRRWHLLGAPYAALVAGRIAAALHIRDGDEAAREAAIDAAQDRHGAEGPRFSHTAQTLRHARRLPEMLRAAGALKSIERTLVK
jgi:hypothetical protein